MKTIITNHLSARIFAVVCKGKESKLTTKAELEELRTLFKRSAELTPQMDQFAVGVARAARIAKEEDYKKNPTPEKLAALHPHKWEQEKLDNEKQRFLIKAALREAAARVESIAAEIRVRALPIIEEGIVALTKQEQETAAHYEVPFGPSPTLLALYGLQSRVQQALTTRALNQCASFIRWLI